MKKETKGIKELTKAELQVMQILWAREKAFVHEILEDMTKFLTISTRNTVDIVL